MTYFLVKRFRKICNSLHQLIGTLEQESESPVLWLRQNKIIVNPHEIQGIILKSKSNTKINLNICNENVCTTDTVNLVGIEIDINLTFDTHTAKLCSKATAQLNTISG